ncbi:MAG: tyrosine-type recombinase/integrase [Acidimicrobiia bacterium]
MAPEQTISDLVTSWRRALRASNRSDRTIDSYMLAANQLIEYLGSHSLPLEVADIEPDHIRRYLSHVLDTRASATARQRYASLKQLFKWLWEEGEIPFDPMIRVKPPKVVEQPVPVLSDDELRALVKACEGKRFEDRRDDAIVRLFIDTGMRLGELAGLTLETIDLDLEVAVVLGKGRRLRSVPFGKSTTRALDRYVRTRRLHKAADQPWLWLGLKGRLSDSGIEQMIARRAQAGGLDRVNPHRFRHTFAHRWLAAGGTEGDLQRIAGWKSAQMLARYGASAAEERARDAHRRLGLADQF